MTAIWRHSDDQWRLLEPIGFPDEDTLHSLVEQAPQLLPLAGSPDLVVLGREVRLGSGWADLIAVEPSGRPAIIEVKLARNGEARRAVVAQVLGYAAYLHGVSVDELESDILETHLRRRGFDSILDAVRSRDQAGSIRPSDFTQALAENLAAGQFRIVMVLDSAPEELVQIAGFLDVIASELTVDLVTVALYRVGGEDVIVPQRVEPGRRSVTEAAPTRSEESGFTTTGEDDFRASITDATAEDRPVLHRLTDWAVAVRDEGLCTLQTYHGKSRMILLPRLQPDNVGLVTLWNDGGPAVQFWRSVFERRAPNGLAEVESIIAPTAVGQGNSVREVEQELLDALTRAYREANGGR